MPLSDLERSILDFERTWWTEPGPKRAGIRSRFDVSPTRYYRIREQLVSSDDALAYDPLVVRRLRRDRRRRLESRHAAWRDHPAR